MQRPSTLFLAALLTCLVSFVCTPISYAQTQPRVVQIFPASDTPLPDNAVFALKLSREHSAKAQAQCDVWGIRSSIPVETISSPRREAVLKAYGISEFDAKSEPWVVLRCQTTFPDAARVTLRWLNPERPDANSTSDLNNDGWNGQRFDFTATSDWPVAIQCTRSNASAGCSPLEPVTLNFNNRKMAVDEISKIVLRDSKGKVVTSTLLKELAAGKEPRRGIASRLLFDKLSAEETYQIAWPNNLVTTDGQPVLSSAAKAKPALTVRIGNYPPLVKFTSNFGIAEKAIGGVVPLTVRAVESAPDVPVKLRQLKLNDEASIIEVMQTLTRLTRQDGSVPQGDYGYDDGDGEPALSNKNTKLRYPFAFPDPKKPADTRGQSWLNKFKATTTGELPKQLEGPAFEVLGVPLKESGLYLLEAESLFLGRSLLDKNRPMYVQKPPHVCAIWGADYRSWRALAFQYQNRLRLGHAAEFWQARSAGRCWHLRLQCQKNQQRHQ